MTTTFNVLGPLEVVDGDDKIQLNGIIQRAALGYLLLYVNKVVATSQLLRALWGDGAPPTARKMLQNAVSGLRRALPSASGPDPHRSSPLVTHAPGYLLRVDPDSVDLCRFEALARRGRTAVTDEAWDDADRYLGDALALWRGPVLADLAENGYEWPECNAVHNTWYAVQEDRAKAALSTGRHLEVIGELEALVAVDPLRERLCAQLMLALYRSGRQADALGVYRRTKAALVGRLGLDPGRELAELERAILDHDPALVGAGDRFGEPGVVAGSPARPNIVVHAAAPSAPRLTQVPAPAAVADPAEAPAARPEARTPVAAGAAPAPVCKGNRRSDAERKWVSAILVRMDTRPEDDPEVLDRTLRRLNSTVRDQVHRFGGIRHDSLGPVLLALFGTEQTKEDDAQRAVRAAMAIRDEMSGGEGPQAAVAVVAGEALVARPVDGGQTLRVTGQFLEDGLRLLFDIGSCAVVRVSEPVRQACPQEFSFAAAKSRSGHDVVAYRAPVIGGRISVPLMHRDRELLVLNQLLDDVRRRGRPHLVTLLGEAGVGKSRIMHEFRRTIRVHADVQCLLGCNRTFGPDAPYAWLAGVVRSYAGIAEGDGSTELTRKLRIAVTGLVGTGPIASQLVKNLRDLLLQGCGPADTKPMFAAWRRFVQEIAARNPLVILLEDLNRADNVLLKFVGDLAELAGMVPLLVVVTGRMELAERTAYWSGGRRNATTMSIEPLSRSATHTLLSDLLTSAEPTDPPRGDAPTGENLAAIAADLVDQVGGNPLFAVEYVRLLRDGAVPMRAITGGAGPEAGTNVPVPRKVHNIIATRLDTLCPTEKAVLYNAAVLGDSFYREVLSVLGDTDTARVEECLDTLERYDLVRRSRFGVDLGHVEYTFMHVLVREVAYSRLPHAVRAEKHILAAEWLASMSSEPVETLVHHYRQAIEQASHASLDGQDIASRACDGLIRAGHKALARGARRTASYSFRTALDNCPPDHPQLPMLLRWYHEGSADAEITPTASAG